MIASGAQTNGTNGARVHGVIMFLMCLDVCAKRNSDVFMIVNLASFKKVSAGIVRTYTVLQGKSVPTKKGIEDDMDDHHTRE